MVVPVLLYGCRTWTMRKNIWNKIQVIEIKYSRAIKGYTKVDHIQNEDVKKELNVFSVSEKITFYRRKWKSHTQRRDNTYIPLLAYNYQPYWRRDVGRPARKWRGTQCRKRKTLLTIEELVKMIMMMIIKQYKT